MSPRGPYECEELPAVDLRCAVNAFATPAGVLAARQGYAESAISRLDLTATEDAAVIALANRQKHAGLGIICDGSLRWPAGPLSFFTGFGGVSEVVTPPGPYFSGVLLNAKSMKLDSALEAGHHPVIEEFRILNTQVADGVLVKQILPAPSVMLQELLLGDTRKPHGFAYPTKEDLADAIAHAYQTVIDNLYTLGCRYFQFDDYAFGFLLSAGQKGGLACTADSLRQEGELFSRVNSVALEKLPHDAVVFWRLTRGDLHTTSRYEGDYGPVADAILAIEPMHALGLSLEPAAGNDYAWLRRLPSDTKLVLEVGSIYDDAPLQEDAVMRDIDTAAAYVGKARIGIGLGAKKSHVTQEPAGPSCGHRITTVRQLEQSEENQWQRLKELQAISQARA